MVVGTRAKSYDVCEKGKEKDDMVVGTRAKSYDARAKSTPPPEETNEETNNAESNGTPPNPLTSPPGGERETPEENSSEDSSEEREEGEKEETPEENNNEDNSDEEEDGGVNTLLRLPDSDLLAWAVRTNPEHMFWLNIRRSCLERAFTPENDAHVNTQTLNPRSEYLRGNPSRVKRKREELEKQEF